MSRDFFDPSERDDSSASAASSPNRCDDRLYAQPLEHERAIRRCVDQEKQDRRLLQEQNVDPSDS